jgi:hypothetical protein
MRIGPLQGAAFTSSIAASSSGSAHCKSSMTSSTDPDRARSSTIERRPEGTLDRVGATAPWALDPQENAEVAHEAGSFRALNRPAGGALDRDPD